METGTDEEDTAVADGSQDPDQHSRISGRIAAIRILQERWGTAAMPSEEDISALMRLHPEFVELRRRMYQEEADQEEGRRTRQEGRQQQRPETGILHDHSGMGIRRTQGQGQAPSSGKDEYGNQLSCYTNGGRNGQQHHQDPGLIQHPDGHLVEQDSPSPSHSDGETDWKDRVVRLEAAIRLLEKSNRNMNYAIQDIRIKMQRGQSEAMDKVDRVEYISPPGYSG